MTEPVVDQCELDCSAKLRGERPSRTTSTSGPSLWRNDASGNNFLSVKLQGTAPNTEAVGGRIMLTIGGITQMREIGINSNFLSQNPTEQIFGLGVQTMASELRIQWPDGRETVIPNVEAGQWLTIRHPDL